MRWKTFVVFHLAMFAFSTVPARAQSEAVVRGQLVAAADGSPLGQGSIALVSRAAQASLETQADDAGRFAFANVAPGEYIVRGSFQGFSTKEIRIVVEPRAVRAVTVALDLSPVNVSVDVKAQAIALPSTHSPSSTTLTSARLEMVPVTERTSLPDAIVTAAPGMIRGHDDFVHIRGEEVALNPFINGVAFWENSHAVFSSGLSPDVIDVANIMTGGFSAEYGNRFGGVVDIVTKSGLRMQHSGGLTLNGGEAGRRSVSGDYGGHQPRLGYYAFGSIFQSDRFLSPPSPAAIHDHASGGHGFVQIDGSLGSAGLLRATVMGDGSTFEIPKTPQDVELRPLADARERTRQQTAIVGWNLASTHQTIGVSFYQRWSRLELSPAVGPLTASGALERELTTVGGKVDITRLAGSHSFKAGIDAVRLGPNETIAYDDSGFRDFAHLVGLPHIHIADNVIDFSGRGSGGQISGYVQDAVRLGRGVTADVGVRVDRYDLLITDTHVSPRVNVAMEVGGGAVVHASYNNFFVPPPVEGVLSSAAGLASRVREIGEALPPVQPTTEHQFELGASAPVGAVQVALTGYFRTSDNPVHTTVWPDARIYSYASFDRARAYGMEARAELPMLARHGVSGYLNYALGRVYFYNPVTGGFVTEAEHLEPGRFLAPMDQTHTLTAGLSYRHARSGLFASTVLEYGSGTPTEGGEVVDNGVEGSPDHTHAISAADAERVPGHFTANVAAGIDLLRGQNRRPRLSLQIDVENIGNNLYLVAQESEFTSGQYSIPRLVSFTARIRF
jgi:hypothetical protein